MRPLQSTLAILSLVSLCVAASVSAHAQNFVVSGDLNIASALTPGSFVPVDAGNQHFFQNILGSGTSVLIDDNGTSLSFANGQINTFYNSLPGVISAVVNSPITPATLSGVNLFIDLLPDIPFTPGELTALQNFSNGGGTIFFAGDAGTFATGNANINAALTFLDSSLQIVPDSLDVGTHHLSPSNIANTPLTTGVTSLTYGYTSQVSGGTSAFFASGGQTFVAFSGFAPAAVPEPSSIAFLAGLGLSGTAFLRHRKHARKIA